MRKPKRPMPPPGPAARRRSLGIGVLGLAALAYVGVDYLRHLSPSLHGRLQPALWAALALATAARAPFYRCWDAELRAAPCFLAALAFMLTALLGEAISVRFVSSVLGLRWHRYNLFLGHLSLSLFERHTLFYTYDTHTNSAILNELNRSTAPLPDTGQWLLLALNEKLPQTMVDLLRTHIISLHGYLMLFIMLGFSALFNCIKGPGLGIATRYMFTMAVGRFLRTISFLSTILPSARPWCAEARYRIPDHPHPWAQKYYAPYASDSYAIRRVIQEDMPYALIQDYITEYRPEWGQMSFLIDILRPTAGEGPSWYHLLKKASGGCSDLMYSGHMLVAVLTAMAWTEAYGGWISVMIWFLVLHSAQKEIRGRHHYTVDCIVAIYVGILLWRMTGFIWSARDSYRARRLAKLDEVHNRLFRAAKDADINEIRDLLNEVELAGQTKKGFSRRVILSFAMSMIIFTLLIVLLAFTLTSDG